MPNLYVMCGPAGCGKTTWALQYMKDHEKQDIRYVSRDDIRFSMLKESDAYFNQEKKVFAKFAGTIAQTLIDGFDVIADATHYTIPSRNKLIRAIDSHGIIDYNIIYIVFNTNVNVCLARNQLRVGRACVPDIVIKDMCKNFQHPTWNEDKRIIDIKDLDYE